MIELKNITCGYGAEFPIRSLSARFPESGLVAVTGPSGCGKSTLLKLLAELISPADGELSGLEGKRISMVFQEDRLIPSLTAAGNAALVSDDERARAALAAVELSDHAGKFPRELSGGMQRRTAIARALAYGGDILLLDEPFKGLDAPLAARVASRLAGAFPLTVVAVHDARDAALLGEATVIRLG